MKTEESRKAGQIPEHSRRWFMKVTGKALALLAILPNIPLLRRTASASLRSKAGNSPVVTTGHDAYTLLKNGLVVDGSGKRGFKGNLLIRGKTIEKIATGEIEAPGRTIDCSGKVIMPGIIDAHSHMDWYLPIEGHDELKLPFTAQGVTSFVAGNCGYGIAGFRKNSPFMNKIESRTRGLFRIQWDTMGQYFEYVSHNHMTHNLINLAGHGTTRASIRGFNAAPMSRDEMKEMLALFEQSMDEGAAGVSLGLQYEPGIFSNTDELREIARLVKRKDKILTVHLRAYSSLAPGYPMSIPRILLDYIMPFDGYEPHNVMAIDEMLNIARETGVRLQISHLIFVGSRTFKTYEKALEHIDQAIREGVDVKFDTYAYHCGQSIINVIFPAWFLAKVPDAYSDPEMLDRLKSEWEQTIRFLGFGPKDIQITWANNSELNRYNGLFLEESARKRGMDWFANTVDFAKQSQGRAAVLNHRYSNLPIVETLMSHPASLFMTDATTSTRGVQNPAAYGNFPLFFQLAREKKLIRLEEAVHKMTGATADRFQIKDRGYLREGLAADITVLDWKNIRDNNTLAETNKTPTGIEEVFNNGKQVLSQGKLLPSVYPGEVIS